MRKAVEAISALDDEGLLTYGPVSVALTSALWDAPARRECLERTADAARDAGSLRLLDLTLWSMSIAELKGGSPRRAAQCIEQVRDLRRAHRVRPRPRAQPGPAGVDRRAAASRSRWSPRARGPSGWVGCTPPG